MKYQRAVAASFIETIARRAVLSCMAAASMLISGSSQAQSFDSTSSPYERGPAPTESALQSNAGPFAIDSVKLTSSQTTGFGSTVVYYPTDMSQGQFGLVVLCPGIGAVSKYYT